MGHYLKPVVEIDEAATALSGRPSFIMWAYGDVIHFTVNPPYREEVARVELPALLTDVKTAYLMLMVPENERPI